MDYESLAKEARREVLTLIHKAGTSHIASNFSVIDIATVLYENLKPEDRVVWSKGWAAATIYYFLYKQGVLTYDQIQTFPNPPYLGLAEPSVQGVECSGGAMAHGLPIAVGIALGYKRSGTPGTVYCIISDGELNEGTTWESAALAAHHKLDNLIVFVDVNKWQAMGKTEDVLNFEPIQYKFESFGWKWMRGDGHDYEALQSVWEEDMNGTKFGFYATADESMKYKPMVVICDTIKGKGVSFMENHLLYHYKNVSNEDYEAALKELA